MQKILVAFATLLMTCVPFILSAVDYYVSPSGNDSNNGTSLSTPFLTIQKAASVAQAGDTVYIRAGTYRETITPTNSGTSSQKIVFQAYNNERVIISGADELSGSWTQHSGNIYYLNNVSGWTSTLNQSDQFFVDGEMMILARHPNVTHADIVSPPVLEPDGIVWQGTFDSDRYAKFAFFNNYFQGQNLVGARAYLVPRPYWYAKEGTVVHSDNGYITIDYRRQWEDVKNWVNGDYIPLILDNHLTLLDTEGEWYRDTSANRLYMWVPGGGNPSSHLIEAKRRDYAFNLSYRSHIEIRGIELFACTITTDIYATDGTGTTGNYRADTIANANNILLDSIQGKYLNHFTDLSGSSYWQWGTGTGIVLSGTDHTIQNSVIQFTAGNGITMIGHGHTANNNYIGNTGYVASEVGAISLSTDTTTSEDMVISNNTITRAGRMGIIARNTTSTTTDASIIEHNLIEYTMLQTDDGGAIYTHQNNTMQGAHIRYNIMRYGAGQYDKFQKVGGVGIYLDNTQNRHWRIHHNIIRDYRVGIVANGYTQECQVYNNTFYNNGTDDDSDFSCHIGSGIYGNRWAFDIVKNIFAGTGDSVRFNGVNHEENQNIENTTDPMFADLANGDFTLQSGSPAASASNWTSSTGKQYTLNYKGAFEPGQPAWTAGASVSPSDPVMDPPPNAPDSLSASVASDTQINLTWNDNSTTETSFRVERSPDGSNWTEIHTTAADVTSYSNTSLTPGTTYYYRVRAYNAGGFSAYTSTVNATTTGTAPVAIEAESLTRRSSSGSSVSDISDGSASGGERVQVTDTGGQNQWVEFDVSGLQPGIYSVTYQYWTWTNRAIVQSNWEGSDVGSPCDQYASGDFRTSDPIEVTISDTGTHTIRYTAINKNASSSGYTMSFDYFTFTKTGDSTGYAAWSSSYSWNGEPQTAATDDPDSDGITNFVEYALGSNPLAPSTGPTLTHNGTSYQFTFTRERSTVTYTVQTSEDLSSWQTHTVDPGSAGQQVSVSISEPSGGNNIFVRLLLQE